MFQRGFQDVPERFQRRLWKDYRALHVISAAVENTLDLTPLKGFKETFRWLRKLSVEFQEVSEGCQKV